MKVLLTYINPENAIKVDFPIIPDYDSRVLLSPSDYKKMVKIVLDQFKQVSLDLGATKKENEIAVRMYIENATVQHIDIVWDEYEQAYLPLVSMSHPINDDFDDDMEEEFDDDFNDFDDNIEEKPHHKAHTHGKKKKLFN
ncbi:MAG: hypothetical protein J5542_11975 [Bacteroidales bacterium]|nr:hypothetical protein [Bacteroidales bacterium]